MFTTISVIISVMMSDIRLDRLVDGVVPRIDV